MGKMKLNGSDGSVTKQEPQVVEVEKIIQVPVEVERIIEVEKIVEKPIEIKSGSICLDHREELSELHSKIDRVSLELESFDKKFLDLEEEAGDRMDMALEEMAKIKEVCNNQGMALIELRDHAIREEEKRRNMLRKMLKDKQKTEKKMKKMIIAGVLLNLLLGALILIK